MRAGRSPGALSANKVSVLGHLRRHGPATPGDIAAAERQQPQSLTRVFAELEADALVSRDRDERDRRQSVLAITAAGRAALTRDMAERDAWLATALAELTETERQVIRLAARLMDQIADSDPEHDCNELLNNSRPQLRGDRMRWPDHAIWWHVYPLGFTGAEKAALPPSAPPVTRLSKLANWLDYLVELGCNGLALGPVFASETHGYDTVDHFRVDSRLGTEDDLLRLVEQASARGVRVLLDGVFNHVGRAFSADASWFRANPDGSLHTFEGHHGLVTLNHEEPAVADYVTEVMSYWLERGIDGWRLDAAYAVPLPFWRAVTDRVRARFPDAWLVGEVIHGDYGSFVEQGGLDSVTQYELWKAVWSSLNDRNLFELAWALKRHNAMLDTFTPHTFLGNHDVTRLASKLTDPRHLEHACVILLTTGGIPAIYAGDEQAFRGVKEDRAGGDDAVRPAFPDHPSDLAPYGKPLYRLHQFLIGLRRRNPWLVRARTTVTALTNTAIAYTLNDASGSHSIAVALNLADAPADVPLPAASWAHAAGPGSVRVDRACLPAAGWAIATAAGKAKDDQ